MNPIKKHREVLGLSQSEVAMLVGISGAQLGHIERAERVLTGRPLAAMAQLFGIHSDELAAQLNRYRAERLQQLTAHVTSVKMATAT